MSVRSACSLNTCCPSAYLWVCGSHLIGSTLTVAASASVKPGCCRLTQFYFSLEINALRVCEVGYLEQEQMASALSAHLDCVTLTLFFFNHMGTQEDKRKTRSPSCEVKWMRTFGNESLRWSRINTGSFMSSLVKETTSSCSLVCDACSLEFKIIFSCTCPLHWHKTASQITNSHDVVMGSVVG